MTAAFTLGGLLPLLLLPPLTAALRAPDFSIVTTLAGGGAIGNESGYRNDAGTSALFKAPWMLALAPTGLYVADYKNNAVRFVDFAGAVSSFIGGGVDGVSSGYAFGVGSNALFRSPRHVALDASGATLFVSDSYQHNVRRVDVATANVMAFAGGGPTGIKYGTALGVGTNAMFWDPRGLVIVGGELFIADSTNSRICRADIATMRVSTLAGGGASGTKSGRIDGVGSAALFDNPEGLTSNGTHLYVTSMGGGTVRTINIADGSTSTLVGGGINRTLYGCTDGTGTAASFQMPYSVALTPYDGGTAYVTDFINSRIRSIHLPTVTTATVAGGTWYVDPFDVIPGLDYGPMDGVGTTAQFYDPTGIVWDEARNVLWVADSFNHKIRRLGVVSGGGDSSGTPTPSATSTPTQSESVSPSATPTATLEAQASVAETPSTSPTVSPSATLTATPSATLEAQASVAETPSTSPTVSPSARLTATPTATLEAQASVAETPTATPTVSPSATLTVSPSATIEAQASVAETPSTSPSGGLGNNDPSTPVVVPDPAALTPVAVAFAVFGTLVGVAALVLVTVWYRRVLAARRSNILKFSLGATTPAVSFSAFNPLTPGPQA